MNKLNMIQAKLEHVSELPFELPQSQVKRMFEGNRWLFIYKKWQDVYFVTTKNQYQTYLNGELIFSKEK